MFAITCLLTNAILALHLPRFLNVKEQVGTFNQEKALIWAFSVIVQLHRLIVYSTPGHWTQGAADGDNKIIQIISVAGRGQRPLALAGT